MSTWLPQNVGINNHLEVIDNFDHLCDSFEWMENAWMKEWTNGKCIYLICRFDEPMQKYNGMKIPSIEGLKGTFKILIGFFFSRNS